MSAATAQLAVANFDAAGLAETLEGVVKQGALSSAGNAVGEPSEVAQFHLHRDKIWRRPWRVWCGRPRCQKTPLAKSCNLGAGALGLGWLSTWFLSGTLEDLLALGLAAAVAYVSVVSLKMPFGSPRDLFAMQCTVQFSRCASPPPRPTCLWSIVVSCGSTDLSALVATGFLCSCSCLLCCLANAHDRSSFAMCR